MSEYLITVDKYETLLEFYIFIFTKLTYYTFTHIYIFRTSVISTAREPLCVTPKGIKAKLREKGSILREYSAMLK